MLEILKSAETTVEIALVGKYIEHQSAYESIYEALTHGGISNAARVKVRRSESGDIEKNGAEKNLQGCSGILIPGGFGERGIEGKVEAIKYARENKIPYLGLCLGMHCASIEFARNVCNLKGANSTEFDANTPEPVICLLEEQKDIEKMGGTMRLGAQPCKLEPNTIARKCYGQEIISERHRHRYEFNNKYRDIFATEGMICSGLTTDDELVEIIELKDHPWFVAVQFHPEFKSKPTSPHPLFSEFIKASMDAGK
jgi:CTP synthase